MNIIENRKSWFVVSGIIIAIGLISILLQGMNLGIDFAGGTIMEFTFKEKATIKGIREILVDFNLDKKSVVQKTGKKGILIRTKKLDSDTMLALQERIEKKYSSAKMLQTAMVGPTIGRELRAKAGWALLVASLAIVAYISFRFQFRFSIVAILALLHDVLIVMGAFSLLGYEINSPFVAAVLTVVGYSINDTIIIFDRIREKMKFRKRETFAQLNNQAIVETLPRSINTSVTTLLPILAILLLGGATIQNFMIALLIGMLAGTYSSIFIASPLLVAWHKKDEMKMKI
ncbi:protein-export membrane protein, SecD/SecF family [Halobacteroides halobius DSM 5150]|uniref:Protein-export membrane protein SecF n=1 Tax=Halobacteroides halobius (strain ATCC 35273 / DSM 5150 / MD-1) TaxID=748449 RepID=L0KB51_HALHC|nr:protein translocase subunit SecF [Halobacteroides halobius]AGB41765.1 protein-export membrane protein, SecD/SecF family [Halobacteroides halobius DSM 5150]